MMPASFGSLKQWQPAFVWALYAVGLVPAAWYFYLGATGGLGADPVKTFELFLGLWAVRFLILTMAVTPARDLMGWNFLRYRRALGLLCFYYVIFHFTVYLVLDQAMNLSAVLQDVLKRPFIMFGMAALVMLLPLAVTSNRISIRSLGQRWNQLHRLVYVIAAAAILHYALSTKVLSVEQYIYIGILIALILYRSLRPLLPRKKPQRRAVRGMPVAS